LASPPGNFSADVLGQTQSIVQNLVQTRAGAPGAELEPFYVFFRNRSTIKDWNGAGARVGAGIN